MAILIWILANLCPEKINKIFIIFLSDNRHKATSPNVSSNCSCNIFLEFQAITKGTDAGHGRINFFSRKKNVKKTCFLAHESWPAGLI